MVGPSAPTGSTARKALDGQITRNPAASPLRPGNVHSADGWDGVLKPVVARYQGKLSRIYFRADAAFAMPEVYEFLEAELRSACRPTRSSRTGSAICSSVQSDDPRTMCAGIMRASAIRPEVGASRAG